MTLQTVKKKFVKAFLKDREISRFLFIGQQGESYDQGTFPWQMCSPCKNNAKGEADLDLATMVTFAMMDSVEVRSALLWGVEGYKQWKHYDDDVELRCYREGRMDVWAAYCAATEKGINIDWKGMLRIKPKGGNNE